MIDNNEAEAEWCAEADQCFPLPQVSDAPALRQFLARAPASIAWRALIIPRLLHGDPVTDDIHPHALLDYSCAVETASGLLRLLNPGLGYPEPTTVVPQLPSDPPVFIYQLLYTLLRVFESRVHGVP